MTGVDELELHANYRAFWACLARASGGTCTEHSWGIAATTGIASPTYNQVHLHPSAEPGADEFAEIAELAERFAREGLAWRLVSDRAREAVEAFAAARSGRREPLYPIMTMPLSVFAARPGVAGVRIRRSESVADLSAFTRCAAACYGHEPELLAGLVHERALAVDGLTFFLAQDDAGRTVGITALQLAGQYAGIYFVGVPPADRRRGIATALVEHALATAVDVAGARWALLQSSEAGLPLYARMGFAHVADYHEWDFPAPPKAAESKTAADA